MKEKYLKPWYWLNEHSLEFINRKYTKENPKEHFKKMCEKAEKMLGEEGFAEKALKYISLNYFLIPTPGITNFLDEYESPISCFGAVCEDSVFDIMFTDAEVGMLSKMGGGTAVKINLREKGAPISKGGFADGVMKYVDRIYETTEYISQKSRRGKCAVYLEATHPEFWEFIKLQDKSNKKKIPFGIIFTNNFMDNLYENEEYQKRWAECIRKKCETGFPYFVYDKNVDEQKPDIYKDKNIKINNPQLCTEIFLQNSSDLTYICALFGMQMFHFDQWKNTDAVEVAVKFVDCFIQDFIDKSKNNPLLARARKFAIEQRAIGVGASGWHDYLKVNNIPVESMEAKFKNVELFKTLKEQTLAASVKMANEYGQPKLLKDSKYDRRHVCLNAIAPNLSSSEVFGQWQNSIEPKLANAIVVDKAGIKRIDKDRLLQDLLEEKGFNNEEVWNSIILKGGSVQHLEILSDREKEVYKTWSEISPMELLIQNSQRQKFIDQGISFNTRIPSNVPAKDISDYYLKAYELGLKSMYYQINENATQEYLRNINACDSCAG